MQFLRAGLVTASTFSIAIRQIPLPKQGRLPKIFIIKGLLAKKKPDRADAWLVQTPRIPYRILLPETILAKDRVTRR
jgi:hypothetical protein